MISQQISAKLFFYKVRKVNLIKAIMGLTKEGVCQ